MRRWLCLPALFILLQIGSHAFGADYKKGQDAFANGDYASTLREWKPLAEQGNARAQASLGWMYRKGLGVLQDDKDAVNWYTHAAQQGNASAQNNLGQMYCYGHGLPQDYSIAIKWYLQATKNGSSYGLINMAEMYKDGTGVPRDLNKAVMWLTISADMGNDNAKIFLAAVENSQIRKLFPEVNTEFTPSQIAESRKQAALCKSSIYDDCGVLTAKERLASYGDLVFSELRGGDQSACADVCEVRRIKRSYLRMAVNRKSTKTIVFVWPNLMPKSSRQKRSEP